MRTGMFILVSLVITYWIRIRSLWMDQRPVFVYRVLRWGCRLSCEYLQSE